MFNKIRKDARKARAFEERIYEQIASELKAGNRKEGLWMKALSQSKGNEGIAQSTYIKLRLQAINDDYEAALEIAEPKTIDSLVDNKAITNKPPEYGEFLSDADLKNRRLMIAVKKLANYGYSVRSKGYEWDIVNSSGVVITCRNISQVEGFAATAKR